MGAAEKLEQVAQAHENIIALPKDPSLFSAPTISYSDPTPSPDLLRQTHRHSLTHMQILTNTHMQTFTNTSHVNKKK